MMKEGGYSANHVFMSTRGLHFKFETKQEAQEFDRVCKEQGKRVSIEGDMVIATNKQGYFNLKRRNE